MWHHLSYWLGMSLYQCIHTAHGPIYAVSVVYCITLHQTG